MRIVSLLPAATEIIAALGLGDKLVGISHECNYPLAVTRKPIVMRGVVPAERMTQAEIDFEVTRRLREGEPLYELDVELLSKLSPDLLITQELCEVCAASPRDLGAALAALEDRPQVLQLTPRCLNDILQNIAEVGKATEREDAAAELIRSCEARIHAVRSKASSATNRPRVFCMEWLDPPYCSGHWVPEMVELCHADDELSRKGSDSVRVPWADVIEWAPEVLVIMPCGYDLFAIEKQAEQLPSLPGWADLPAVRNGRVYAADANAYFARPGPRVVDGLELLAHLIHPELFDGNHSEGFAVLRTKKCGRCETTFLCHPRPGCWCEGLDLAPGVAACLSSQYADCLCPACLKQVVNPGLVSSAGRALELGLGS